MTDVIENTLNGSVEVSEVLSGGEDEAGEPSKHLDNTDTVTEELDENDSSENANVMEVEDEGNEDSNAFPDTSQSDQNENFTADGDDSDGDDEADKDGDNGEKVAVEGELLPAENDNETSMDLSELEIAPVKSETLDEDTIISQDENELLEDEDDHNNYSGEESETVLMNNINDNSSGASNTLSSSLKTAPPRSSQMQIAVRNGDAREDKPLLTSLLSRGETSTKTVSKPRNFSISDGTVIAKELEEQVSKLNQLLVLKEKEWSAILRLKKHVEYALDQVKCTQRISKVQEGLNGPMSTTEIKACMNLIVSDKETFNIAERQIEESIESAENENESLQSVFPFRSSGGQVKDSDAHTSKGESFTATAALQKLCERKRKAMDELVSTRSTRIRITDVQSHANPGQIQSKVIGNGRKGAIVDVQSIIQSHRNLTGDKVSEKQRGKKVTTYTTTINMQPDRQYLKTLEELVAMAEAERQKETAVTLAPPPSTTSQAIRSITPKPKNGKPMRQAGSNSILANASSSGSGTLAKMLSPSTHSSIGSNRNSNDATTSQKFSTKLPTSDGTLSLANLLATSKLETKGTLNKIKKERTTVRDDDSNSQQEAVPICQGCNLSRAQFVCAGCANQWYCSRECQVAAWDEHSEICSG